MVSFFIWTARGKGWMERSGTRMAGNSSRMAGNGAWMFPAFIRMPSDKTRMLPGIVRMARSKARMITGRARMAHPKTRMPTARIRMRKGGVGMSGGGSRINRPNELLSPVGHIISPADGFQATSFRRECKYNAPKQFSLFQSLTTRPEVATMYMQIKRGKR